MAITTQALLEAALPGQRFNHWKGSSGPSFWTTAGSPSPATYPGASTTWTVPTNASAGAYPFVNPASGNSYLARVTMANGGTSNTTMVLYDRLAHTGAITPAASTQALTTTPLTRPDANGAGVELWWEWITASGATPSDFTCSYTNQSGTAAQTTNALAGQTSSSAGGMQQFTLPAGDSGIRTVESFTGTGAIGGTGMLVLLRRVAVILNQGTSNMPTTGFGLVNVGDAIGLGMPQIYDSACLVWMSTGTTSIHLRGSLDIISG